MIIAFSDTSNRDTPQIVKDLRAGGEHSSRSHWQVRIATADPHSDLVIRHSEVTQIVPERPLPNLNAPPRYRIC
jgi:hypothetical protein